MLFDAIRSALSYVRAISRCLQSLDQNLVVECHTVKVMDAGISSGGSCLISDMCGSQERPFGGTMTIRQLRVAIERLEHHLEQILRFIHKA
jgi:hypothetical protein